MHVFIQEDTEHEFYCLNIEVPYKAKLGYTHWLKII